MSVIPYILVVMPWLGMGDFGTPAFHDFPDQKSCELAKETLQWDSGKGIHVDCIPAVYDKRVADFLKNTEEHNQDMCHYDKNSDIDNGNCKEHGHETGYVYKK